MMPVTIIGERPLGAQTVRGTVLFADLRGYTTIAERLNPATVVALLESYFDLLVRAVEGHDGTVFHLAGDSLMAGFGLADPAAEPTQLAVAASRRIVEAFAPEAARWQRRYGVVSGVGIGVHVGELAYAELGPTTHRHRTLIGDTVNVAARLCQRARAGEVLMTAGVANVLVIPAASEIIALPDFALRGRGATVKIFCVPAPERLNLDAAPPGRLVGAGHPVALV